MGVSQNFFPLDDKSHIDRWSSWWNNICAVLFLFVGVPTHSQNLITNNSFEENTGFPNALTQWHKCIGWNNIVGILDTIYPTPDYFHNEGLGEVGLPNNIFAYVKPYTGKAVMGFGTSDVIKIEFREYISSELIKPMIPGITYKVSFFLTNGYYDWFSKTGVNGIGASFTTTPPYQESYYAIDVTPQIQISGSCWNEEWQKYSFEFIADSAYNYITFGCFSDSLEVEFDFRSESTKPLAYYFIDEVYVGYSIQTNPQRKICIGDEVVLTAWNDTTYFWVAENDPGTVLSKTDTLVVSPQDTTTYIVYGAYTSDTVQVIPSLEYCEPEIKLPNVFTPNGDALNDFFKIKNQFAVKEAEIVIINRWGIEVYSGDALTEGWNGTRNEENCPDGVYFWNLVATGYNGKEIKLNGNLTLLR